MKILKTQSGAALLEIIIAMGIFITGLVSLLVLTVDAGNSVQQGVMRTQATLLAQEGIEAIRTIRDNDFSDLTNGPYGIVLSGGTWLLSGTSDTTDGFTRVITITDGSIANTKLITSEVLWEIAGGRELSTEVSEIVSNWKTEPILDIDCFDVDLSGASIEQGSVHKIVRYIWISNPSCSRDVILDKIILTWDKPSTNFFKIRIDSYFKYQGNAVSGQVLDLVPDETLPSGDPAIEIDQLRWYQSIIGTDIGVEFIMTDGSSESFTIPAFN